MSRPGLGPRQSTVAVPKMFSEGSFQSLSTTKDILEYGPQSPLANSLDSSRASVAEALDQTTAIVLSPTADSGRHRSSTLASPCPAPPKNTADRHSLGVNIPFHELPSPSNHFFSEKGYKSRIYPSSPASSPQIGTNYLGMERNACYRDLFKHVTKVAPGQAIVEKTVPDDLTVERLVMKVISLKKDEPTIPAIEAGLPYMDGRAMAYLLKDIAHRDKVERAMEIFEWLRRQTGEHSQLCDVYVYTTGIKLCGMRQALGHAICLIAEMKAKNISCNIHTLSALMNTCIKCGQYSVALDVFHKLQEMGCVANVVTYNTLVDLYGKLGKWREAIGVIDLVWASGLKPEVRTYNTAIIAANVCNQPHEALQVFDRMLRDGFEPIDTTYTALISAYSKSGNLEKALHTYDEMVAKGFRCNIITYGSLISAAEQRGQWDLALWFSDRMDKDKIAPNTMTFNALLSACAQGAESERAEGLFNAMNNRRLKPDAGAFSALILAHVRAGHWRAALQAWDLMHMNSVKADPSLYATLMQCLWDSGSSLGEAHAAKLYTQGCRSQSVPRAIKQFHSQNGNLQIRLTAVNSCIAILSLHKMLCEAQKKAVTDSNIFGSETVELVVEYSMNGEAQDSGIQLHIQNAIEIMLAGLHSPFSRSTATERTMLTASADSLLAWLQSPEAHASLSFYVPFLPSDLNARPITVHQTSAVEESTLRRQMKHDHDYLCQIEQFQHERQIQAYSKYRGIRQECEIIANLLAAACHLSLDTCYAALNHMDCALLAGVCLEGQSQLVVAACLLLVARTESVREASILCNRLENAVHAHTGALIPMLNCLQELGIPQSPQDATPSMFLDMYLHYLGIQNSSHGHQSSGQHRNELFEDSARKLLCCAMADPSAMHIRPSMLAAGALAVARRLQGKSPTWPASLQSWTLIPESSPNDFEMAIQKLSDISDTNAYSH